MRVIENSMSDRLIKNLSEVFTELQLIAGVRLFASGGIKRIEHDQEARQIRAVISDEGLFAKDVLVHYEGRLDDYAFDVEQVAESAPAIVAMVLQLQSQQQARLEPDQTDIDLSEGAWQAYIDESRFEKPSYYPNMARHRIIYVIDQDSSNQQYRVHVKKSYLTKANKYTKIEDLPYSVINQDPLPKFVAPEDRRILHMMIDSSPDAAEDETKVFHLEQNIELLDAKRLFRFIIKTGRSFWQNTESSCLLYKEQDSHQLNNPWFRITKVFADFHLNMDTGHCGPVIDDDYLDEDTETCIDTIVPKPCMIFASKRIETPWADSVLSEVNYAEILFDYDGQWIRPEEPSHVFKHKKNQQLIKRNLVQEYRFLCQVNTIQPIAFIKDATIADAFFSSQLTIEDETQWLQFMLSQFPVLKANGWQLRLDKSFGLLVQKVDEWYGLVNQNNDGGWFDISIGVMVNDERVNVLPLILEQLKLLPGIEALHSLQNRGDDELFIISRKEGERIGLAMSRIKPILNTLVELLDGKSMNDNGEMQLTNHQLTQLVTLDKGLEEQIHWGGNFDVRSRLKKLSAFQQLEKVDVHADFNARLRDYQQEGLNWLRFLRQFELGGILADDMGLGKTVQTLAHLLLEHGNTDNPVAYPSIVIAPTSLMANWSKEAQAFAPGLKVLVLHGSERKQHFESLNDYDLVLTTYPLLIRDAARLLEYRFRFAILDEAQVIKNSRSKMAQTAYQINSDYRLCLTGTPVENHLGELWSLFNFLMPGFLGDEEQFTRLFRTPIEKQGNQERRDSLVSRINPFLLRRTKDAVVAELPPKTVIEEVIELDDEQSTLYESIRISMHQRIQNAIKANGIGKSNLVISDALLKLRQVCCAPSLVKLESAQDIESSAKLEWLSTMIPSMVEEGRRILIFSQFTEMLRLIEERLLELNIGFVKLTGSTKDRATPVDAFQQGGVPVFLISLKAGGTGLNLTAADTVIHYDPWWNPAAENQASDRAYRIGQDKPVFVYKLICKNTVEEKIQAMQERKKALADSIYSKGAGGGGLSQDDINVLFEPLG